MEVTPCLIRVNIKNMTNSQKNRSSEREQESNSLQGALGKDFRHINSNDLSLPAKLQKNPKKTPPTCNCFFSLCIILIPIIIRNRALEILTLNCGILQITLYMSIAKSSIWFTQKRRLWQGTEGRISQTNISSEASCYCFSSVTHLQK